MSRRGRRNARCADVRPQLQAPERFATRGRCRSAPRRAGLRGLSADLGSAAPGLIGALIRLLGESLDDGLFVRLPHHGALLVRRQISPPQIVDLAFDPTSGRFDCLGCLCLRQHPPQDPSSDTGFLSRGRPEPDRHEHGLAPPGAPFDLEPWEGCTIPAPASGAVSLNVDTPTDTPTNTSSTTDRVHRKARV